MGVNDFLALAARVAYLGPEMIAGAGAGLGPGPQCGPCAVIGFGVHHYITRPLQVVPVDLDIARQQQPRTAITPDAVQAVQRRTGYAVRACQTLCHGRFAKSIAEHPTAGQGQWLFNHRVTP